MISKVNTVDPTSFKARVSVGRGVPSDLKIFIKHVGKLLPDDYKINVKQNWTLTVTNDCYDKSEIPFAFKKAVKGNIDVVVERGKRFDKKVFIDKANFNWWRDKQYTYDSYAETASEIYNFLEKMKNKLNLYSK